MGGVKLGSNMMASAWKEFPTIAVDFSLQTEIVWKLLLPRPSPPNITGPPCTLLNPLFGNEKRIVGSGLMSEGQYTKALKNLLQKMQDILDKKNPLLCYTLSDNSRSEGSSNDEDYDIPWHDNMNHGKAKEELEDFERFQV